MASNIRPWREQEVKGSREHKAEVHRTVPVSSELYGVLRVRTGDSEGDHRERLPQRTRLETSGHPPRQQETNRTLPFKVNKQLFV